MDGIVNTDIQSALAAARVAYVAARPKTVAAHEAACAVMPGGNTRTVLFHGPVPLRMARGEGAWLTDVDGHRYLNLLGEYTAGIYGHSDPRIAAAIRAALDGGVNLSGHNTWEAELARLVCARFPAIDLVRFTNSGTEANLMAIGTARAFTGREKVMVMREGYHGGLLYFGHGGIPINVPFPYVFGDFNDVEATRAALRENAGDLACVIVEPMIGSGGALAPVPGFLEMLREETEAAGALLVFDEVMTSRFAGGGMQGRTGIRPDLTTLGKYIGGGMSAGAFGGRGDIMAMYDPTRPDAMPHAGTFNNNVITMAAGVAGLSEVFTEQAAETLHARGERLRDGMNEVFGKLDAKFRATGMGSILGLHARRGEIVTPRDAEAGDEALKELLFLDLLEAGFYIARRGFIALALPVSDVEIDGFLAALESVIGARRSLYCAP